MKEGLSEAKKRMGQALQKMDHKPFANPAADGNTKVHMVAADARTAIVFVLSFGHDHDTPHGRALLGVPCRRVSRC
jgi:hypothetical protein